MLNLSTLILNSNKSKPTLDLKPELHNDDCKTMQKKDDYTMTFKSKLSQYSDNLFNCDVFKCISVCNNKNNEEIIKRSKSADKAGIRYGEFCKYLNSI